MEWKVKKITNIISMVLDSDGNNVATVYTVGPNMKNSAHMIAASPASPALLDALESLLKICEVIAPHLYCEFGSTPLKAKAAIALAKGE